MITQVRPIDGSVRLSVRIGGTDSEVVLEPARARELADAVFNAADEVDPQSARLVTATGDLDVLWDPRRRLVLVEATWNDLRVRAPLEHDQVIELVDALSRVLPHFGQEG